MELRHLLAQVCRRRQGERLARFVRTGPRLSDHERLRLCARLRMRVARCGELEREAVVALEGDDGQCARERRRESIGETVRHLRGARRRAECMRQLTALACTRGEPLGVAPRAHEHAADEVEDDRRGARDQRELEQEPTARGREDGGARPIDHDRPAGNPRGRVGHEVIGATVEPAYTRQETALIPLQLPEQVGVCRADEVAGDVTAATIEHLQAGEAELVRRLRRLEVAHEQRAGEDSREAACGIASGDCGDDDAHVRAA